ncbi:MAG: hypothetical protein EBU73_06860 [Chitinophagia bacterium]|nr:hypothetical protein [Chitinophagia bacterium]
MAKATTPKDQKFDKQDFDMFEALAALDNKDYGYYDRLTVEQQKKFVPYMLLIWMSCVKGDTDLQNYYLQSVDFHANKYMFNEYIGRHPKLQWLMLCSSSPGLGKKFHQYISHISTNVRNLKSVPKVNDIKDFYKKLYPNTDVDTLDEISKLFVAVQKRKVYFAEKFPSLKIEDIEILNDLVTQEDIDNYETESGN